MPDAHLFPHQTARSVPPTYLEVQNAYIAYFHTLLSAHEIRPLVLNYHLAGLFFLIAYLLVDHRQRPWLYKARWGALGMITWWEWRLMWETSSQSQAISLCCGLVAMWSWWVSLTWLVFERVQWDAKRVQRRKSDTRRPLDGEASGTGSIGIEPDLELDEVLANGDAQLVPNGNAMRQRIRDNYSQDGERNAKRATIGNGVTGYKATGISKPEEYFWHSYPETFGERFEWLLDLLVNFRGPGWSWAIPNLPPPPLSVSTQIGSLDLESARTGISHTGLRRFTTRREVFNAFIPRFCAAYIAMDILKVLMMKDPYFIFGPTTYDLPSHLQGWSPMALLLYRETTSALAIVIALEMAFLLAPLMFCLLLGPDIIGQRGEAWYYATSWGSFSSILDKGLSGLWGTWWHQTFRFIFAAPTTYLIRAYHLPPRSPATKLIGLFFAFGISGSLHAAGSVSQVPHTKPFDNMIFFLLQALGVFIQTTTSSFFHSLPRTLRQIGNLLFVVAWLYATGWYLTDDFARGGIWLVEPLPLSPMRGLGFGVKGDGWWCWRHMGSGWYSGKHWWESGLAIF